MPTTFIYLRVSTNKQEIDNSLDELLKYCKTNKIDSDIKIYREEGISGKIPWKKRKLKEIVDLCKKDDNIVFSELSRAGRNMNDVYTFLNTVNDKKINVYAMRGDCKFLYGKEDLIESVKAFCFNLVSQMERQLISERVKTGIANAKKKRADQGLPPRVYTGTDGKNTILTEEQQKTILELLKQEVPIKEISEKTGIKYGTIYYFQKKNVPENISPQKPDLKSNVLDLYKQGKNVKEIALALGIGCTTVRYYIPKKHQDTDTNIRLLFTKGVSKEEIAKNVGVSMGTVRNHIKKITREIAEGNQKRKKN